MAYWASDIFTGTTVAAAITAPMSNTIKRISAPIHAGIGHMRGTIGFASGTNPVANDVIEMAFIPPGCVPIDFAIYADDFGSDELDIKAGVMTGAVGDRTRAISTVGQELLPTGSILLRTAGAVRHGVTGTTLITAASVKAFNSLTYADAPRSIGIGWVTAAATPTSGSIRTLILDLWYRQQATGL